MPTPKFLSVTEQVAAHLREELLGGRWTGTMPGRNRLAEDLGVNRKTVEAALRQLEHEGLLLRQGPGCRRRIELPPGNTAVRPLRVAMLNYEPLDLTQGYMIELHHLLTAAGHSAFFTAKSQTELGMDLPRISRLVRKTAADAWVVGASSREVLEWFTTLPEPAFALFGRRGGLPIAGAGPDKPPAYAAATRRLIELGHHRIVLLARQARRLPQPGASERAFLDELVTHGITPGPYNLPDWKESIDGFHGILESLFRHTPPSALIIDEAPFFTATQQFLAGRGLQVPEDVSLICTDGDPHFAWYRPTVAHIRWDSRPVVRRIVRWAASVSRGRTDTRQSLTRAEFVDGGTVAPVKSERD